MCMCTRSRCTCYRLPSNAKTLVTDSPRPFTRSLYSSGGAQLLPRHTDNAIAHNSKEHYDSD